MSTSYGPPGWADPTSSTAPDPSLIAPPPPVAVAPAPLAEPDAYVRPPLREEAPAWVPPAGEPGFVATTTTTRPGRAIVPPDRRQFDGRRVKAYLIDGVCIGAIPTVLQATATVTDGAMLVFVAIQLIYYFLCEVTTGQTVGKRAMGLRVVALDGSPATAKAISARTVLRVLEMGPIGLIVYSFSGRRRRRLGDFLGGTVVVDAHPDPGRPPKSPLLVLYPVGWLAGAAIGFSTIGHGGDIYLAEVDEVCRQGNALIAEAAPADADAAFSVAEMRFAALRSLAPPPARRALHEEILVMEFAALKETRIARMRIARRPEVRPTELARLVQVQVPVRARYAQLGLNHCSA